MSSALSVSNDSSKPEEFSLKDIEVFLDSGEQNWFKRAHVGKLFGLEDFFFFFYSLFYVDTDFLFINLQIVLVL